MLETEIVFTAYNRPYYLEATIASWNEVRLLGDHRVEFSIDPSDILKEVVEVARNIETLAILNVNYEKLGVLKNPWNAINESFKLGYADFVILAEDDVAVSTDVLEYFNWAAETYKNDDGVLCVNAYSRIGGGNENEVTRDYNFSPLVWGIWKDRWENLIRDTWDKDYSTGKSDGSEAGWDWNINRIIARENMAVIKPIQSRSDHLGQFQGTHMTPDLYESSRGVDFVQDRGQQNYIEI